MRTIERRQRTRLRLALAHRWKFTAVATGGDAMRAPAKLTGMTAGTWLLLARGEAMARCDMDCDGDGNQENRRDCAGVKNGR